MQFLPNNYNITNNTRRINPNPDFDYIMDDLYGEKSSYSAKEIASRFSNLTGQNITEDDITKKFGKSTITDSDLYHKLDKMGNADGRIGKGEIDKFMAQPTGNAEEEPIANQFGYLTDNKTDYTLKEVTDKIADMTGKHISEADLKKILGGREKVNDFELMLLLDNNRNGHVSKNEMNDLISDFKINYTIDDEIGIDPPAEDKKTRYRGDGNWDYTADEFKKMVKNGLGLDLTDADMKKLFADGKINDRTIDRALDLNDDGQLSSSEFKKVLGGGTTPKPDVPDFKYLDDNKTSYTKAEMIDLFKKFTGKTMNDTEFDNMFDGKQIIRDNDLLHLIDKPTPNGSISLDDMNKYIATKTNNVNYAYDGKASYSADDLAKTLSDNTGVKITGEQVAKLFGKDTLKDADLIPYDTAGVDGRIGADEVKAMLAKLAPVAPAGTGNQEEHH